ncbi:hypothetical protein EX30DRAFT_350283 [Ascodesmis nigricans]|uniref:Uncharacterized protein n=1 Tax=Ascodesmis nigricans TaxID=341454 RepID=A0A4S2MQ40_9PEZI|nr:hypothetical protein EX30DRAFT_350283 [Ascodesmis nigricans]
MGKQQYRYQQRQAPECYPEPHTSKCVRTLTSFIVCVCFHPSHHHYRCRYHPTSPVVGLHSILRFRIIVVVVGVRSHRSSPYTTPPPRLTRPVLPVHPLSNLFVTAIRIARLTASVVEPLITTTTTTNTTAIPATTNPTAAAGTKPARDITVNRIQSPITFITKPTDGSTIQSSPVYLPPPPPPSIIIIMAAAAAAAFIAFSPWLARVVDILDFMILALGKVRNFGALVYSSGRGGAGTPAGCDRAMGDKERQGESELFVLQCGVGGDGSVGSARGGAVPPTFTPKQKRAYIEEEEDEYIYGKSIVARHEWPHPESVTPGGLIYSRQAQHRASCFEQPPQPPDFSTHVCPPLARFQFAVAWLVSTFAQLYHHFRSAAETILTHTLLLPLVTTVTLISSLLPEFPFTTTRPGRIAVTILILPLCVQASISFVVLSTTLGLAPKTTMMFQFLWRCLGRPPILQPVDVEAGIKRRHSHHHYHDEKTSSQHSTPSYDEKSAFLEDERVVIENERERIRTERDELSAEQTQFRKQQEKQAHLVAMAEQKIEKYEEMELELKRQEKIQVQKIEEDQIRLALRSAQLEAREIEVEKRARIVQHHERVVECRERNVVVREREVKDLMREWEGRRNELVRIVENVEEKARRQKKVMEELMRLRGSASVVNTDTTIAPITTPTTTAKTTAATSRTPTTHSSTSSTSSTTATTVKSSRPITPAPQRSPPQRTPQNRPSTPSSSRPATPSTPRGSLQPAKKMPLSTRSGNGPTQTTLVQRSAAGSLRSPSRLSPRQQSPQVVGQVRRKQAVVNGA